MFKNLTKDQDNIIAGKVIEWGNLMFIALTAAQFITPSNTSTQGLFLVLIGYFSLVFAYAFALWLMKRGGEKKALPVPDPTSWCRVDAAGATAPISLNRKETEE